MLMIILYFIIRIYNPYIFLVQIEIPKQFHGPYTVMYVEETCSSRKLSTIDMTQSLAVFERKMLWKIYGPVKESELWGTRQNDELEAIIKGENIFRFIKCKNKVA